MFLNRKIKTLTIREILHLLKDTIIEFFKEKTFIHCASLSYYTVLTLVPILYLAIVTFGKVIGQKTMLIIISKFLKENVGITDIDGIMEFMDNIDFEKGNITLQIMGIIMILFSSSALFNSLKYSINEFLDIEKVYKTNKRAILASITARLSSILILTFFGLIVILTYFFQTFLISFGSELFKNMDSMQWLISGFTQHVLVILSNVIIFTLILKYLHDAIVPWKIAIVGSIFTSVLLYFGQLLIRYYLTTYFFAKDGGIAGSILIILVWMYYSSHIIFLGAKFTTVYARKLGKPLQVD